MRWISTKELLPKRGKKVLVIFNDDLMSVSIASRPTENEIRLLNDIYEREFPEETFDNADWHYPVTDVTHWMYVEDLPLIN